MRVLASVILSSAVVCAGCLGEPIPKQVRAGSTFAVPFLVTTAIGFGAQPGTQGPDALLGPDPQRGDVRFALCSNTSCTPELPLVTRFLSRVHPDPASPAGLTDRVTVFGTTFESTLTGQPVAVLDVPVGTPAGIYTLRYFRAAAATPAASTPLESIEILAGTEEQFTDIATEKLMGLDVSEALRDLVPYPSIVLNLLKQDSDRPAAATVVVSHPPQVSIEGGYESGGLGRGSVVRLGPGPTVNSVSVHLVDPDLRTKSLALAFQLTDPSDPVIPSEFGVVSQVLYDEDGIEMPLAAGAMDPGNRFSVQGIR